MHKVTESSICKSGAVSNELGNDCKVGRETSACIKTHELHLKFIKFLSSMHKLFRYLFALCDHFVPRVILRICYVVSAKSYARLNLYPDVS